MVIFQNRDYSHKFTKNVICKIPTSVEPWYWPLFICRRCFFCPPHYSSHSFSSPSRYLKWRRHHFCFDYRSRERKTNMTKAPCGDNEIKTARPLFTPLPSVFFFSFSDWHLLIWGSWLPITCFQSHFKSAAGDPTLGLSFRRVYGGRGERECQWREERESQIASLWRVLPAFCQGLTNSLDQ